MRISHRTYFDTAKDKNVNSFFLIHWWNWLEGTRFRKKAGNRKYMAIHPSPPSKHSYSELSITCGHSRLPLRTSLAASHILSSDPFWLPCICGQCSKQPFAYHWVHTLTPLSWPDYPCPGGPSTTDGSSSRGFGVVGVKWYGFLYSQACLRSLSLTGVPQAGGEEQGVNVAM